MDLDTLKTSLHYTKEGLRLLQEADMTLSNTSIFMSWLLDLARPCRDGSRKEVCPWKRDREQM
jgi:hypothetical protein